MAFHADFSVLADVRARLRALLPTLDSGLDNAVAVAAYLANDLALLSRAAIAVAVDRSVPWVNAAILRVELQMARDPRYRERVDELRGRLQAALHRG